MHSEATPEPNSSPRKRRKKQEDFYTGLPNWIYDSPNLTPTDRDFLMFLARHSNKNQEFVWPSEPNILAKCKIGRSTYYKVRKKLTELGLISYISGRGRKHPNLYRLNWLKGSDEELAKLKANLRTKKKRPIRDSLKRSAQDSLNCPVQDSLNCPAQDTEVLYKGTIIKGNNNKRESQKPAAASSFSPFSQEAILIDRIRKLGIPQKKAKALLVRHGKGAVKNQLDWLAQRDLKNPAGAFITALKENWPEPMTRKSEAKRRGEESLKYKRLYSGYAEDQEKIFNRAKDMFKRKGDCGELRKLLNDLDPDYKEQFREFEQEQEYEGLED